MNPELMEKNIYQAIDARDEDPSERVRDEVNLSIHRIAVNKQSVE
jgi:hypothetical protein